MPETANLSHADVAKLLHDPNTDNRAMAASKVADAFSSASLSAEERAIAEDIFRVMLKDAAVRVRSALSESLKDNPDVPHEIAASLANDVDAVAMPMIQHSVVLSDEDLIKIISTRNEDAQKAVASRSTVSQSVSEALVETGTESVVSTLVSNSGANISSKTYDKVLSDFGDAEAINKPMTFRSDLPVSVSEKLVTLVSDQLRDHIMKTHTVSPATAADLLLESREKATVSLVEGGDQETVQDLVDQLDANNRLSPTLMIRALCMGDITFFEVALAKRVNIPVMNAYKLVHDGGRVGLQRLFDAAEMPPQFLVVAQAALDISKEMIETGGDDKDVYRKLMIERVLTQIEDDIDTENLDYLIGKLGGSEVQGRSAA